MIKNFLTVATRNFFRQGLYSFINVVGLASGLTCVLFIYLWVNDEVRKDTFHQGHESIFRVVSNLQFNEGEILTWTVTPGPLAEDIRANIPEVEIAVRTQAMSKSLIAAEGQEGFMESGLYADPDFFDLFSFDILEGRPNTDTADVSSISISHTLAQKLFPGESAVGKGVRFNSQLDFTVAAVFRDPGAESSLQFDYVLPFEIYKKNRGTGFNWGNYDHPLYLKLVDASQTDAAMDKIKQRVAARAEGNDTNVEFFLQPLAKSYLYGEFENGRPVGGRIKFVQIFSIVAVFILVIACINFMNMATARAAMRAKEVGIRKVVGAQRRALVAQFLAESTMISLLAMLLALAMVFLLLPVFNQIVSKEIEIQLTSPVFLAVVVGTVAITGLFAGSYPAFFLSGYQPVQVLKSSSTKMLSGTFLRKALVVFQFCITVVLIASSLVVYQQITYMMNKDLGYNRESVMTFSLRGNLWNDFESFRNEVLASPAIKSVSRADNSLVQVQNQNGSVTWPGKPDGSTVFFRTITADFDFPETMGLQLKEGRFFSREFNDTSTFLLSERAVEVMGLADPIGTRIVQWGYPGTVIGVVKDFHGRSMHENIDPFVIMHKTDWAWRVFVRFEGNSTEEAITHLETVYRKFVPNYPLSYTFLDADFESLYKTEMVTAKLALGFTVMAVIISALGLLGLAAYTAERRRKEISIRKTLGASVPRIVSMMSGEIVRLSLIAAVVGCPIAYYLMKNLFLEEYAYRTTISWDLFVLTAVAALVISVLTVILQVVRAATANPVDALRNE